MRKVLLYIFMSMLGTFAWAQVTGEGIADTTKRNPSEWTDMEQSVVTSPAGWEQKFSGNEQSVATSPAGLEQKFSDKEQSVATSPAGLEQKLSGNEQSVATSPTGLEQKLSGNEQRVAISPAVLEQKFSGKEQSGATSPAEWEQMVVQGRKYREQGNSFRALQMFQRADSLHSNDTLRREIADCLYARGEYQKCIDLCETLLMPDSLEQDLYLMARCYDKMEMPREATHYQMLVAERNIENCNNLLSLCKTLIDGEMYDDALELLNRYCTIDSTHAAVNSVKAYALHKMGRWTEAIDLYERLVAEGDNRATTLYYLGLSYYRRKNIGEAYDLLKMAVERDGRRNSTLLSRFGVVELAIAYSQVTWVKNHRPCQDSTSILSLFDMEKVSSEDYLLMRQRIDSACTVINEQGKKDIEEAIAKMYPDPEVLYYLHFSLANHYFWKSDDKLALKYFQQCLADSPNHPNVYYNMAVSYHKLQDYRNELKYYQLFVDKADSTTDAQALQSAKEAIAECRKVLFMKEP